MNAKKDSSGSLYRLILREYLLFTLILAILFAFILSIFNNYLVNFDPSNDLEPFIKQFDGMNEKDYKNVNPGKYLTSDGYFEVLDWDANVLFCSNKNYKNTYTMRSLYWIPSIDSKSYFFSDEIHRDNGQQETILYEYENTEKDGNSFSELKNVLILDEEGEVLYSTDPKISSKTSKARALTGENGEEVDSSEDDMEDYQPAFEAPDINYVEEAPQQGYLQKYYFLTSNNEPRYLIVHTFNSDYNDFTLKMQRAKTVGVISYITAVILMMIIFGKRLNRKVNMPLEMLEDAMNEFKEGKYVSVEYEGLDDLEEICDTFNDMSEQLGELDERRQELEEDRQKMLADISHDLKTPITVIQGYSKALVDGMVKPEDQQRYLQAINQRSNLMEELVNAFYEYSRLDHPLFHLEKQRQDFAEFLREYLADKFEEIELMDFNLDIDIPEERVEIDFDRFQMKRVFENILSNAIKHNPAGTTIYVHLEVQDHYILLHLGDDGVGIPEALKERIFEPFIVGEEARTSGKGSGLGLSIAKKIIEAHGGSIYLEKTPKGTMFCIKLLKPIDHK